MKIDDGIEGSTLRGLQETDTSEADWISVVPYHLAQKSRQLSSAGSHTALDSAFHSQLPGSTVGWDGRRQCVIGLAYQHFHQIG